MRKTPALIAIITSLFLATPAAANNGPIDIFMRSINSDSFYLKPLSDAFLTALEAFGVFIFQYNTIFLITLAPLALSIWISWRFMIFAMNRGDNGYGFLLDILKKGTIFFFIWIFFTSVNTFTPRSMSQITDTMPAAYKTIGTDTAGVAFQTLDDMRKAMLDDPDSELGCETIYASADGSMTFSDHGGKLICNVERTHVIGVATAWAMLVATWQGINFGILDIGDSMVRLFGALVFTAFVVLMAFVYMKSAAWFVSKVFLSILMPIIIIAAFSPVLALLFLFRAGREIAINGVKYFMGCIASALGVAIAMALSFYLVLSLPSVFNNAIAIFDWDIAHPIADGPKTRQMAEFIYRISVDPNGNNGEWYIPMHFWTPWFLFMVFAPVLVFALGKKLVLMMNEIINALGGQGDDQVANNISGMVGNVATTGAKFAVGGVALKGSMMAMSTTAKVGAAGLRKAGVKDTDMKNLNPFGALIRYRKSLAGGGQ